MRVFILRSLLKGKQPNNFISKPGPLHYTTKPITSLSSFSCDKSRTYVSNVTRNNARFPNSTCLNFTRCLHGYTLLRSPNTSQRVSMSNGSFRNYSNSSGNDDDNYVQIPQLMQFPPIVNPKLINYIRNHFLSRTLIRPYFDKEFSLREFNAGAKYAALHISQCLSSGDIEGLEDTCTSKCLDVVTKNLSLFSMRQRAELDLKDADIYLGYTYQIGIMMDDDPNEDGHYGRQVECTWVGHACKNYLHLIDQTNGNPMELKKQIDLLGGPTILNFRFIRDYSKNVEDSWTVNALNYFKLYDA